MTDPRYETFMGRGPKQIEHWEHCSCPDAETYLSGIDYYQHPRECRLRLRERYPQLRLAIPDNDTSIPHPTLSSAGQSADHERHTVRWGDGETGRYLDNGT